MINGIPDYLEDFEEIQKISKAVNRTIWSLQSKSRWLTRERWVHDSIGRYERWTNLLEKDSKYIDADKVLPIVLFPCDVVTINEIQFYLGAWISADKFNAEYDSENCAVKIKLLSGVGISAKKEKWIRNFIPMNMALVFETVDQL